MEGSKLIDGQMVEAIKRVGGGLLVPEVCCELGISSATFYKWRSRFGGMGISMMLRAGRCILSTTIAPVLRGSEIIKKIRVIAVAILLISNF